MEIQILKIERKIIGFKHIDINEKTSFSDIKRFFKGSPVKKYSYSQFVEGLNKGKISVLLQLVSWDNPVWYPSQSIAEHQDADLIRVAILRQVDNLFFSRCKAKKDFEFYLDWFGNRGRNTTGAQVIIEFYGLDKNSLTEVRSFYEQNFSVLYEINQSYGKDLLSLLDKLLYFDAQFQPIKLQYYVDEVSSSRIPGNFVEEAKEKLKLLDQKYFEEIIP